MSNTHDEKLVYHVVYFILAMEGGRIKIGTTGSIASCFQGLQRAHGEPLRILATVPGDYRHEAELHDKFRAIRIYREWFRATPELFAYIADAVAQGPTFTLPQPAIEKLPSRAPLAERNADRLVVAAQAAEFAKSIAERRAERERLEQQQDELEAAE